MDLWKYYKTPFPHVVIDDFFHLDFLKKIVEEFPPYDSGAWTAEYNNPVEIKKTCNHWDKFPKHIYQSFTYFCTEEFTELVSYFFSIKNLVPDYGLHGGGMHSHKRGGKLNIHKDYSIHPKINKMRNLNLIIYITPNWKEEWNGGLELWSHDEATNKPKELVKTIDNVFNRAVIFDTTKNSWHGLPNDLNCPENVSRNSLAMYYVSEINDLAENRNKALFVPNSNQIGDKQIEEFCKKRSL
jgi:hypothetical protein